MLLTTISGLVSLTRILDISADRLLLLYISAKMLGLALVHVLTGLDYYGYSNYALAGLFILRSLWS